MSIQFDQQEVSEQVCMDEYSLKRAYAANSIGIRTNEITVAESLNLRISTLEKEIERLKSAKERLENSGLLNCRIDDLRIATNY